MWMATRDSLREGQRSHVNEGLGSWGRAWGGQKGSLEASQSSQKHPKGSKWRPKGVLDDPAWCLELPPGVQGRHNDRRHCGKKPAIWHTSLFRKCSKVLVFAGAATWSQPTPNIHVLLGQHLMLCDILLWNELQQEVGASLQPHCTQNDHQFMDALGEKVGASLQSPCGFDFVHPVGAHATILIQDAQLAFVDHCKAVLLLPHLV